MVLSLVRFFAAVFGVYSNSVPCGEQESTFNRTVYSACGCRGNRKFRMHKHIRDFSHYSPRFKAKLKYIGISKKVKI